MYGWFFVSLLQNCTEKVSTMPLKVNPILSDAHFQNGLNSNAMHVLPEELRDGPHFEFLRFINTHDDPEVVLLRFDQLFVINVALAQIRKLVDNMRAVFAILSTIDLMKDAREITNLDQYTKKRHQLNCVLRTTIIERKLIVRLYNICNDDNFLSNTYHFDAASFILTEEQTGQHSGERPRKPQMSFEMYKMTKQRDQLIALVQHRNQELYELICKLRRIIFEVNVCLGSRTDLDCEICQIKPNKLGKIEK